MTNKSSITDEQLALINQPLVESLLYDINLLPEQLLALNYGPGHKHWDYMLAVIGHFTTAFKERDELISTLRLVSVGLSNGNIKSKPIISFKSRAESVDIQSLAEIIDAVLAKHAKEKA